MTRGRVPAPSQTTQKRWKRKEKEETFPLSPPQRAPSMGKLTKTVTKDHGMEIFSTCGKIKTIDMPVEGKHLDLSEGQTQ